MTIHVTETQQFIVRAALEVSNADERLLEPKLIDDMIRAMLVIEEGGMKAYMLTGFKRSCMSRMRQNRLDVEMDKAGLSAAVGCFQRYICEAPGEAASRIRGNRARLIRGLVRRNGDWQHKQLLRLRQREPFYLDAVNRNAAPHPEQWHRDDFDFDHDFDAA